MGRAVRDTGPGTIERLLTVNSAPPHVLVLTAAASYGALALAMAAGWPAWAVVVAAGLPWILVFSSEMVWTYRHFHWLALFYVLVATQGGHFVEHLVQIVQLHVLDRTGPEARGVFGNLDIEWVHFGWNTWVLVAVVVLLIRYRRNRWLWATLVLAGWHEVEHSYLIAKYLSTDVPGHPGLLARGGAIGGGVDLARADLHFLYNLVETLPLFVAFGWTLRRTYDDWLARALPHAGVDVLVETTRKATTQRFAAGQVIVHQGDLADCFYVLVRGEVEAVAHRPDGTELALRRLEPGEFFGEIGLLTDEPSARTATVRAVTAVEVLALDRSTFREVVTHSRSTGADLAKVAIARIAHHEELSEA